MSKLECYFDFKSTYRSIWLTGYILITWLKGDFWHTVEASFYPSGEYENLKQFCALEFVPLELVQPFKAWLGFRASETYTKGEWYRLWFGFTTTLVDNAKR
jgi:hypothetical protein